MLFRSYRIFDEAVKTSLPYAQLSSFETFAYGAVLLDSNMIIGVKVSHLSFNPDEYGR